MADAEHVQRCGVVVAFALQGVEQGAAALRAMRTVDRLLYLPPQRGLPVAAVLAGLSLPVEDPVRPVGQVLRIEAGQMFGQLKAAA